MVIILIDVKLDFLVGSDELVIQGLRKIPGYFPSTLPINITI